MIILPWNVEDFRIDCARELLGDAYDDEAIETVLATAEIADDNCGGDERAVGVGYWLMLQKCERPESERIAFLIDRFRTARRTMH